MTTDHSLKYHKEINVEPALVYRAFTKSTGLRQWLCDGATTDTHPGGRIVLWWNDGYVSCGEFTALEQDKEIAFTWHGKSEPQATTVKVTLTFQDGATKLELVHSGLGSSEAWEASRAEFDKGWQYGLENLVSTLETGKDLRIYNRPMLGIMLGDFNAEIAARENIPVTEGVRIDGTLEGMGAARAGLQQGDVLAAMDSHKVQSVSDLTNILSSYQAGDTVQVKFYRGPEQQQVQMELSGRPVPDIPWEPTELAARVEKLFSETNDELTEAIAGASEAAMETRPAADEWSAKEVIAHLLLVERENSIWIGDLLGDQERWTDDWGENVYAPVKALTETYTTTDELIRALKNQQTETLALLQNLPQSFLKHKASYWQIADNLLNAPYHTRSHLPQITKAIESARQ